MSMHLSAVMTFPQISNAGGPPAPQANRVQLPPSGVIRGLHGRADTVFDFYAARFSSHWRPARPPAPGDGLGRMAAPAAASPISNLGRAAIGGPAEPGVRRNHFGELVKYAAAVPEKSAGHADRAFFADLGSNTQVRFFKDDVSSAALARMASHPGHESERRMAVATLRRRAEQEYILQNMDKGALQDAATQARVHGKGIATRPTALAAHMAGEVGAPTKPQEFKNKTAKAEDIWLCDELNWDDIGKVVHYDPSVGWTSTRAAQADRPASALSDREIGTRWKAKLKSLGVRARQLGKPPPSRAQLRNLRSAFFSRIKEYAAEDSAYRGGELSHLLVFAGPRLRLKVRPDADIVGDRDLFAFTDARGRIVAEDPALLAALRHSDGFQAQHGGIWYWQPGQGEAFNHGIKAKIMGSHGPSSDAPLVLVKPDGEVTAVFYVADKRGDPSGDRLESVWTHKRSLDWLKTTPSGKLLAGLRSGIRNVE